MQKKRCVPFAYLVKGIQIKVAIEWLLIERRSSAITIRSAFNLPRADPLNNIILKWSKRFSTGHNL